MVGHEDPECEVLRDEKGFAYMKVKRSYAEVLDEKDFSNVKKVLAKSKKKKSKK